MEKAKGDVETLRGFVGRDQDLRAVPRFSLYEVMLYRTNLYTHSHRVAALTRAINPLAAAAFGTSYDSRKAELMAYVHDDAELVFGDIQAGNKSRMTTAQLQRVKETEMQAIKTITQRFPESVEDYSYRQLLEEAAQHSSLEAQVVCYADKYDALGEALHEVYAGNHHFTTNVVNEYGRIPTPPEYYADYFQTFGTKFPRMQPLLAAPFAMFEPVSRKDYSLVTKQGELHSRESLTLPTGDHHYDNWRAIIVNDTNDEVQSALYGQTEFLER